MNLVIKWLIGSAGGIIAIVAVYAWITTAAYNRGYDRGVTETTERMKKAIAEMQKFAVQRRSDWDRKTPGEKTLELQKRCVAACQQEPKCEAACRQ